MKYLFLIIAFCVNYNTYAFSFDSLFGSHKHKKAAVKSADYTVAKQNFENYCTKKLVPYGTQIRCTQESIPPIFKFNASATVKCKQKIIGINNDYPGQIDLPVEFIKQMKICRGGKIFGPNILHTTNVSESDASIGIQRNQTDTFYDVVCHDEQSYSSSVYKAKQSRYSTITSMKLHQCEHVTETTSDSARYILIFKILGALAVFSFLLRFYFKYRNRNDKN